MTPGLTGANLVRTQIKEMWIISSGECDNESGSGIRCEAAEKSAGIDCIFGQKEESV